MKKEEKYESLEECVAGIGKKINNVIANEKLGVFLIKILTPVVNRLNRILVKIFGEPKNKGGK